MRHPWYEVNCQISLNHWWILILYPAVTNSLKRTRQVDLMTSFSQNCKKVWFPEKVFCWLVMTQIGSFLNIFAVCRCCTRQWRHSLPEYKGVLSGKSLLLVSHGIGSFLNIVAWYNVKSFPINGSWLTNKGIMFYSLSFVLTTKKKKDEISEKTAKELTKHVSYFIGNRKYFSKANASLFSAFTTNIGWN